MSAETVLKTTLDAAAAVTALVSTRIYPDTRPQDDVLPAIVYARDGTEYVPTIHGTIALTRAQLSVACFAATRAAAEAVADAAQAAVLAARFNLINRGGDFDVDTRTHIVTLGIEHLS
jgi:hypothetical protein